MPLKNQTPCPTKSELVKGSFVYCVMKKWIGNNVLPLVILGCMIYGIMRPPTCPACPACPDPKPQLVLKLQSMDWGEIRKLKNVTINWAPSMTGTFVMEDVKAELMPDSTIAIRPSGQAAEVN